LPDKPLYASHIHRPRSDVVAVVVTVDVAVVVGDVISHPLKSPLSYAVRAAVRSATVLLQSDVATCTKSLEKAQLTDPFVPTVASLPKRFSSTNAAMTLLTASCAAYDDLHPPEMSAFPGNSPSREPHESDGVVVELPLASAQALKRLLRVVILAEHADRTPMSETAGAPANAGATSWHSSAFVKSSAVVVGVDDGANVGAVVVGAGVGAIDVGLLVRGGDGDDVPGTVGGDVGASVGANDVVVAATHPAKSLPADHTAATAWLIAAAVCAHVPPCCVFSVSAKSDERSHWSKGHGGVEPAPL
jgi:hypothetical protein